MNALNANPLRSFGYFRYHCDCLLWKNILSDSKKMYRCKTKVINIETNDHCSGEVMSKRSEVSFEIGGAGRSRLAAGD